MAGIAQCRQQSASIVLSQDMEFDGLVGRQIKLPLARCNLGGADSNKAESHDAWTWTYRTGWSGQGHIDCFETTPENAESVPDWQSGITLLEQVARGQRWNICDLVENNKSDIEGGALDIFMEFRTDYRQIAKAKVLDGAGGLEREVVRDYRPNVQAITGTLLGNWNDV